MLKKGGLGPQQEKEREGKEGGREEERGTKGRGRAREEEGKDTKIACVSLALMRSHDYPCPNHYGQIPGHKPTLRVGESSGSCSQSKIKML